MKNSEFEDIEDLISFSSVLVADGEFVEASSENVIFLNEASLVADPVPQGQDSLEYTSIEIATLVKDFEAKSEYLLSNELRYGKNVDLVEISMDVFLDEIFLVNHLRNEDKYLPEEIQSPEYKWWLSQKKANIDPIPYSQGYNIWNYNPIVVFSDKGKHRHRILLRDDTQSVKFLASREFAITAPITYVGRSRHAKNARFLFAFAIDLDGVGESQIRDLFHQQTHITSSGLSLLPPANIIVNSGTGLHLYYILDRPVELRAAKVTLLQKFKHYLTDLIWNDYTSSIKTVQFQGIFQGFRIPGTKSKFGTIIRAFQNIDVRPYSIEELNKYTGKEGYRLFSGDDIKNLYDDDFKTGHTLKFAEENWPEWYEDVIIKGIKKEKRRWKVSASLYKWWLKRLKGELPEYKDKPIVGHRYFCIFALAVFAAKCEGISESRLRKDAFSLLEKFDSISDSENNRFTQQDIEDALMAYKFEYCTFPKNSIQYLTGMSMPENRRNGRTQAEHLKRLRILQNGLDPEGEWRHNPRKNFKNEKAKIIRQWVKDHPNGSKMQCAEETSISFPTVHKWWPKQLSDSQKVQLWKLKNIDSNNKSKCARETGLSRPTVIKYWNINE